VIRFDTHYGGCESSATGGSDCPTVIVTGTPFRPPLPGVPGGGFLLGSSRGNLPYVPFAPPHPPTFPETLPVPPHKRPPPPKPPAPIGEPPPSEPPYGSYDEDVLKGKGSAWEKFLEGVFDFAKILKNPKFLMAANAADMIFTNVADVGLPWEVESQRVTQGLEIPSLNEPIPYPTFGQATLITGLSLPNPFNNPDYSPDPYAEPTPAPVPYIVPNPAGLPYGNPFEAPLPEVRVIGTPARAPGLAPAPGLVSPVIQPFGLPSPDVIANPFVSPRTNTKPVSVPRSGLARPFLPTGYAPPSPFADFGPQTEPLPRTKPTKPDTQDCQCSPNKKDKKKKREPREVCHEGTYVELKNGLLKYRRKEIPCR
jgi:hypothetical protein